MRIAHITDPHIRLHVPGSAVIPTRRSREAAELFRTAVADAVRRGAEVLAVTGDLVDVPGHLFDIERDPAGDAELWQQVRRDYRWVAEVLDDSGLPWIALPGNHDTYRVMREEFGPRPYVVDHGGVRFISFWDRETADHTPQRILTDRRRFESALRDDATPQVHLQHFVITPELNARYPHTYREGEQLRQRLAEADRTTLVLSGHYHRGTEPEQHGRAWFSVTPALTEAPHPYRIFDLRPDADGRGASVTWEQVELDPDPSPAPVVFLDRDGCINTLAAYHSGPEAMELIPGAAAAIRRLREAGWRVVVITNQACVGLGYVTTATLAEIHDRMAALLAAEGTQVDAIYASLEAGPDGITEEYRTNLTRKPLPTLLHRAVTDLNLDLTGGYMVGDRQGDVDTAIAAGVTPLLVRTGNGRLTEQAWGTDGGTAARCTVVDHLAAAATEILRA